MADEPVGADGGAIPSAQPSQPADVVSMPSSALKSRLDEERAKARGAVLKELGFEKVADVQAILKAAKDRQDAELSEVERLKKQLGEVAPKVDRLTVLEQRYAAMVEERFASLPESVRTAIDDVASGNAEERMRMIEVFRKSGLLGAQQPSAPSAPATPPVAPVPTPARNGATPPAPPPAGTRSKYDEFRALDAKSPMAAAIFYAANKREIEASRPQQ